MGIEGDSSSLEPEVIRRSGPTLTTALLLAALLPTLGLVWALLNPLGAAPDEPNHLLYAAAVVRGDLGHGLGGTMLVLPARIARYPFRECMAFHPTIPVARCAIGWEPTNGAREVAVVSKAAGYPPLYYAIVGWPTLSGFSSSIWLFMRLLSVMLASLLVGLPIVLTRRVLPGWAQLAVLLTLAPLVSFLTAVVNPDGAEIAAAIGLGISVIGLQAASRVNSRRDMVRAVAGVALTSGYLMLSRPFSFLEALALLTVFALLTRRDVWRKLDAEISWIRWVLTIPIACFGLGVLYAFGGHHLGTDALTFGTSGHLNVSHALHKIPRWLLETVGIFGWNDYQIPPFIAFIWLAAIGAFGAVALRSATVRERWIVLINSVVAVIAMPVATAVIIYSGNLSQFQGRYEWPLVTGIMFTFAIILAERGGQSADFEIAKHLPKMLIGAVALVCIYHAFSWGVTVVRYGAGLARIGWWPSASKFQWYLSSGRTFALSIAVLAFMAVVAGLLRQIWRSETVREPTSVR